MNVGGMEVTSVISIPSAFLHRFYKRPILVKLNYFPKKKYYL
jgi:hypothetical protein